MSNEANEAAVVGARSRAISVAILRAASFAAGVPTDRWPIPDDARALMLVSLGTVVGSLIAGLPQEAKGKLMAVVMGSAADAAANIERSVMEEAKPQ